MQITTAPIINAYLEKLGIRRLLEQALENSRYAGAIEILIKNMLMGPAALYRVPAWVKQFDPHDMGTNHLNDDVLGRALDKLFRSDRATLQAKITVTSVKAFDIDLSQIHNDSTTVKFYGAYKSQSPKAVRLKRGHSKDHRPDLKQLLYNLSVARDGAIPIHFKAYDGNKTDDTLHIENWLTLRGLVGSSGFLYVADSKLCTTENMTRIDRGQGRFVTIVPRTRSETQTFAQECHEASVRWELLTRRPSTRIKGLYDVFSVATGSYQLEEGFRLYWYRSSEKRKRDSSSRKERIELALQKLAALNEKKHRGRRTERSLLNQALKITRKLNVESMLTVSVESHQEETYVKTSRGKPSPESAYRRIVKRVPHLVVKKDHEQIARSKAVDGIFPLTTNTKLSAKEALDAYKYQPHIEKRFSGLKSDFSVAPVFLKKTERVEALMFVVYIGDLIAALVQRDLRRAMKQAKIGSLPTLPEERPTSTPTWEQIQRLFSNHCMYQLVRGEKRLKTFWDDLSAPQQRVLQLLQISPSLFCQNQ
jgi:transposase